MLYAALGASMLVLLAHTLLLEAPIRAMAQDPGAPSAGGVRAAIVGWLFTSASLATLLPAAALTPLREGLTQGAFEHALAMGLRRDWSAAALIDLATTFGAPWSLRTATGLDIAAQGLGALAWGMAVWRAGGSRSAVALVTLPWFLPPMGWHVALSGTVSSHLLMLTGCVAWARIEAGRAPGSSRVWPVVLGVATLGAAGMRYDAAGWFVVLALLLVLLDLPWGRAIESAASRRLIADRPWAALLAAGAALGLLGLLRVTAPHVEGLGFGSLRWVHAAFRGAASPLTDLPLAAAAAIAPAALLAVGGSWTSARRRPLLAVTIAGMLVVIWQVQLLAAHGAPQRHERPMIAPFEAWRYLMTLLPLLWVPIAVGAHHLSGWRANTLLVLLLLPPIPELLHPIGPWESGIRWPRVFGVEADRLTEVRALTDTLSPPDVWIARVAEWSDEEPRALRWMVVDWVGSFPLTTLLDAPADEDPGAVLDAHLATRPWPATGRRRAWFGVDCLGRDDTGCDAIAALPQAQPTAETRGRPFVHSEHVPPPVAGIIGAHDLLPSASP